MKLTDAKVFNRTLSFICLPLSILLIIRRFLIFELDLVSILTAFFWPIIGIIIAILFLKKDGYTTSASEIMFYFFILYCSFYFIFNSISLVSGPGLEQNLGLLSLNIIIIGLGWLGIAYYVIF